jgi:hypothetical protein
MPPALIYATGGGSGSLVFGSSENHFSISLTCPYNGQQLTCRWGGTSGSFKVSAEGSMVAKEVKLTTEVNKSAFCGESVVMSTELSVATYPAGAYISTI